METQHPTTMHHGGDASRPSIGFPLGTALLLLVIFSLSGFFSCCYHWEKLRSLRRSLVGNPTDQDLHDHDLEIDLHHPSKPSSNSPELKQKQVQSLPVLMPGDQVPKFIAMPCPCEPKRPEMVIAVEVQTPPVVAPRLQPSTIPPRALLFNHVARFGGVFYEG
ncbi:hypothetical protein Syun_004392 [Stephania yunnanensis]|uniref:Hydroxyproline-rich glycoprotein family protein n=1 Tax=Stephania yunnanensis TaxID=152371 RepID=A0AAP0L3W2_9MAGN